MMRKRQGPLKLYKMRLFAAPPTCHVHSGHVICRLGLSLCTELHSVTPRLLCQESWEMQ